MSARIVTPDPEPWDFNPRCNDCRADLRAVLDELVAMGELVHQLIEHGKLVDRYAPWEGPV
jgi:hypothetical protein